ncbi:MAG TPA: hypothetical protein PL091_13600 [Actinomycetota bacterium]|nr:hypothetical protein [Actinomycetota bacterium]HRV67332.1 hypothetical protein [Candidatus Nanopelagicales bacterium]
MNALPAEASQLRWRWLIPFYLPPARRLAWTDQEMVSALEELCPPSKARKHPLHPSELLREIVTRSGSGIPTAVSIHVAMDQTIVLTDGGVGALVTDGEGSLEDLLTTSTSEAEMTMTAAGLSNRLTKALDAASPPSNAPLIPRGEPLWWHRILLDCENLEQVESLQVANSIGVPGTTIRVGHGYSSSPSAVVEQVQMGILLALEEWLAVHDVASQASRVTNDIWMEVSESGGRSVRQLRPRLVLLSAEVAARSASFAERKRVVPDLPLAVWEAAGEAWRTSRDLDSALARIRGLDELAQGVNEQFSAASAFRRNTLLFVITALSLLSLIPVAGDFATNPDDSVDNLLRLGVALAVVLIAMLALGATLWMTRADRRRPPVE